MYRRFAITLPEDLVKTLEKKRKQTGMNRSEFLRKALKSFIFSDAGTEKMLDKKYGPIYKSLEKEFSETSEEMMSIASETVPEE